jgi:hypothetical protein
MQDTFLSSQLADKAVLKELPEEGPSFGEGDMIREESSL